MIKINKEQERGKGVFGWLKANYSFSFSSYFNPHKQGFKSLRVLNEDFISPHSGFGSHGHKNMEILTVVLSGILTHKDSLGNEATLSPGKIQRMYAGTGIVHSEYNHHSKPLNLIQIWIEPNQTNRPPEYEEKVLDQTKLQLLASPDGRHNSIKIYQNLEVWLNQGLDQFLTKGDYYIHVISGKYEIAGHTLNYGDSIEVLDHSLNIKIKESGEILIFKFLNQ